MIVAAGGAFCDLDTEITTYPGHAGLGLLLQNWTMPDALIGRLVNVARECIRSGSLVDVCCGAKGYPLIYEAVLQLCWPMVRLLVEESGVDLDDQHLQTLANEWARKRNDESTPHLLPLLDTVASTFGDLRRAEIGRAHV